MLKFLLYLMISLFLFRGQFSDRNNAAFSLSPLNLKSGHPVVCVCVCARARAIDEHYKINTVKHNSCIFYYYVKTFLQEQHVSTQLRGHHQAGIVMKLKMSVHKQLAYQ
jgi:hypothetical protein